MLMTTLGRCLNTEGIIRSYNLLMLSRFPQKYLFKKNKNLHRVTQRRHRGPQRDLHKIIILSCNKLIRYKIFVKGNCN
jgi:hypothetical protein